MSSITSRAELLALESQAARAAQAGRQDEALGFWERVLSLDPSHARALDLLGQRAFRQGNLQQARSLLDRLLGVAQAIARQDAQFSGAPDPRKVERARTE